MRIFIMILVGFSLLWGEHYWDNFRGNYRQDGYTDCIGPRNPILINRITDRLGGNAVISEDSTLYIYTYNRTEQKKELMIIKNDQLESSEFFSFGESTKLCIDSEGILYFTDHNYLYAYDPKQRYILWKTGDYAAWSIFLMIGPDNIIYLFDAYPYINAFERTDGKRLWRYDLTKGEQASGNVALGVDNGFYIGREIGFYGNSKLFLFYIPDVFKFGKGNNPSGPSIAIDGTIYSVSESILYAYKPGLDLKWQVTLDDSSRVYVPCAIDNEGNILVASHRAEGSYLHKVSSNGQILWKTSGEKINAYDFITVDGEGKIFLSSNNFDSYCFNKDGRLRYKLNDVYGNQSLIGPSRRLYLVGSADIFIFKDQDGFEDREDNNTRILPEKEIKIYPNPFKDRLTIETPSSGAVYDITGRIMTKISQGKNRIDTGTWNPGVYIIKSGKEIKRIVKTY